ncbi:hypothetical protein FRB90_003993 [Tulasnella sp. 427]|nr:hypothetical protein FRB90_003993 [Tulasnella sp. 427]
MICLHRPNSTALVPNLKKIKWEGEDGYTAMLPLLSPCIEHLDVTPHGDTDDINNFFAALEGHQLSLKSFTLRCPNGPEEVKHTFSQAVSTWTGLQYLNIPTFYLTSPVLQAVMVLPELVILELNYWVKSKFEAPAVLQYLSPNAFPALEGFAFMCNLVSDALRIARESAELFFRLKTLHVNASDGVGNADVLAFVRHLGLNCQRLEQVSLNLCVPIEAEAQDFTPLSVGVLESLFPCRGLKVLGIGHPLPITLHAADMERAATAWPKMTELSLTTDPDLSFPVSDATGNSWSLLPAFAQHFPRIRRLGLYFAKTDSFPSSSGDLYPAFEFRQPEVLVVGLSVAPGEPEDVGRWIAGLCRKNPKIEARTSEWYVGSYWREESANVDKWKEVEKFLKLSMSAKNE